MDHLIIVSLLVQKLVKTVVFGLRNVRYGPEGDQELDNNFLTPSPPHPLRTPCRFFKGKTLVLKGEGIYKFVGKR